MIENGIDYKGFWQDFTIADAFGLGAIQDTYNRASSEGKSNAEYITTWKRNAGFAYSKIGSVG